MVPKLAKRGASFQNAGNYYLCDKHPWDALDAMFGRGIKHRKHFWPRFLDALKQRLSSTYRPDTASPYSARRVLAIRPC